MGSMTLLWALIGRSSSPTRYIGPEPIEQPHYGVYAVRQDGEIRLVTPDVLKPNGIAVSPDGATLYVAEHFIGNQNFSAMPEGAAPAFGPMRSWLGTSTARRSRVRRGWLPTSGLKTDQMA